MSAQEVHSKNANITFGYGMICNRSLTGRSEHQGVALLEFVRLYYDVCKEIEILEQRLDDLEDELKAARQLCFSGTLPSDTMSVHVPLDKALEQYDAVVARETSDRLTLKKSKAHNTKRLGN